MLTPKSRRKKKHIHYGNANVYKFCPICEENLAHAIHQAAKNRREGKC